MEGLIRQVSIEEDHRVTQIIHANVLLLAASHEPRDTGVLLLPIYDIMLGACLFHMLHQGETNSKWIYGEIRLLH
jgi:hypothetical protein